MIEIHGHVLSPEVVKVFSWKLPMLKCYLKFLGQNLTYSVVFTFGVLGGVMGVGVAEGGSCITVIF